MSPAEQKVEKLLAQYDTSKKEKSSKYKYVESRVWRDTRKPQTSRHHKTEYQEYFDKIYKECDKIGDYQSEQITAIDKIQRVLEDPTKKKVPDLASVLSEMHLENRENTHNFTSKEAVKSYG